MSCYGWWALHLHYHSDQTTLLLDALAPALSGLARQKRIDRFFFVRYALGGPHVRLRLRVPSGEAEAEAACGAVEQAARKLFARQPSAASWPEELIRSRNQAILAGDHNESDDSAYPDNSVRRAPFMPEVERYGGPDLLPLSMELFTLSSAACLERLRECRVGSRSRQLIACFELWMRLALGLTGDTAELTALAGSFGPRDARERLAPILAKADQVFEAGRNGFVRLIRERAEGRWFPAAQHTLPAFDRGALWLSRSLAQADPGVAQRIRVSQMHMTANRLGLTNVEETYLGRLLARSVEAADLSARPLDGGLPAASRVGAELAVLASRAVAGLADASDSGRVSEVAGTPPD